MEAKKATKPLSTFHWNRFFLLFRNVSMETNLLVKYSKIECVAFDTEVHTVDKWQYQRKITCPVNAVIKIVPIEAKKATKPLSPIPQ
jgi:hypothetical protein